MHKIRVIMYNNVGDYPDAAMEDGMPPQAFARDMTWLNTNGYRPVSLSDAFAMAEGPTPIEDKAITLTFDGGYRDANEYVAPILSRLGFPATFFVPHQVLGSSLTIGGVAIPCMNTGGVNELISSGFELGAYLLGGRIYHESMQNDLIREIDEAADFFSKQLQIPLEYVSVREGIPGKAVRAVLQAHGIKALLTKCPTKRRPHRYCIGRIQIDDDDPNIFLVKISKNYLRFKDSRAWPYMRKYKLDRLAHHISDRINARNTGK